MQWKCSSHKHYKKKSDSIETLKMLTWVYKDPSELQCGSPGAPWKEQLWGALFKRSTANLRHYQMIQTRTVYLKLSTVFIFDIICFSLWRPKYVLVIFTEAFYHLLKITVRPLPSLSQTKVNYIKNKQQVVLLETVLVSTGASIWKSDLKKKRKKKERVADIWVDLSIANGGVNIW